MRISIRMSMCTSSHHLFVAGTVVTWAQSKFYGGFIPKGSWFSALQRAAMKTGRWADPVQTIGGSIAVGASTAGSMFAGCGR